MLCCFFCIKFDCYYCFDNGFGSEYNEVNYFGFLSNVFYLSILFFCKILKMQMIKKKNYNKILIYGL